MRSISEHAVGHMLSNMSYKNGNTQVVNNDKTVTLFLHGNAIAIYDKTTKALSLRDCGWRTVTTKERLNTVLAGYGSAWRVYQLKGDWYLTDGMGTRKDWASVNVITDIREV